LSEQKSLVNIVFLEYKVIEANINRTEKFDKLVKYFQ